MSEQSLVVKELPALLREIEYLVNQNRQNKLYDNCSIKDLRVSFDQESARMNQAVFNEQPDQLHNCCLRTIAVLVEILSR